MAAIEPGNEVQVGAQGRLVIPAALCKSRGLKSGDRLVARWIDDSLVLERREAIDKRLQDHFRHISKDGSLMDELSAEPRAEAANEGRGGMILDTSALLVFLSDEPGAARVGAALDEAVVFTVNLV